MHIIIGLILVLAVMYFWLLGHWFARIIMLPLCGIMTGGLAYLVLAANANGVPHETVTMVAWLIGAVAAWPVASLPIYYWRHRMRHTSLELALR